MRTTTAIVTVTVDIIVSRFTGSMPEILLIKRGKDPYKNAWALPGGKLDEEDTTLDDAARRELIEETGLIVGHLAQVGTYGDRGRDPRGRFISVVFVCDRLRQNPDIQAGDDAAEAAWFPLYDLPVLAFDHDKIIADAMKANWL